MYSFVEIYNESILEALKRYFKTTIKQKSTQLQFSPELEELWKIAFNYIPFSLNFSKNITYKR